MIPGHRDWTAAGSANGLGANCGFCQDPQWHVSNKGFK